MSAPLNTDMSSYESMVQRNIEENRRMLISLGLLEKGQYKKTKPPQEWKQSTKRKKLSHSVNSTPVESPRRIQTRRFSLRSNPENNDEDIGDESYTPSTRRPKIIREQTFGDIEGVAVGDWWPTRVECSTAGVHRPTVAGIHGRVDDGCYSIALSGGYEDDLDCGEYFTYTGSGGRDLKGTKLKPKNLRTAPQSKDQDFDGINAALALNIETRRPVRVIRGYKLQSTFAPEEGYRYDGLYSVEKCWTAVGVSGFRVCKYALKRLSSQDPPPWKAPSLSDEAGAEVQAPNRSVQGMNGPIGNLLTADGGGVNSVVPDSMLNECLTQNGKRCSNGTKTVLTRQSTNTRINPSDASPVNHNDVILNNENGFKGFPSNTKLPLPTDDDRADTSVSDGLKQMSILEYFQRATKPTKPDKCLNVVNPKALRNNRFSSFWTPPTETDAHKTPRKNQPVATAMPRSDVKSVPEPETSTARNHLWEKRKKNSTEPRAAISRLSADDSLRPCLVKLILDDGFKGWDCFHGFGDGD